MRRKYLKSAVVAVMATGLLTMTGISAASNTKSAAAPAFGVNATGTVQFWARDATDAVPNGLVKEFNATHPNLKIVLHLTSPNDDTSQLAAAIRAGDPPDLVGLNDIDVPEFEHEGALLDITKYVNALPLQVGAEPGPPEARRLSEVHTTAFRTSETSRSSGTTRSSSRRPGSPARRRRSRRWRPIPRRSPRSALRASRSTASRSPEPARDASAS